jgi:hypothetical protein
MLLVQYGDLLKSSRYLNLKQIIQISHKTIPGTEKFKVSHRHFNPQHCLNYTQSGMTNLKLPDIKGNETAFEIFTEGKTVKLSHEECLDKLNKFTKGFDGLEYTSVVNSAPIFYPSNITLGLLGSIANKNYTVIPGNYNFIDSLKLLDSQKAPIFICEEGLLEVQPAKEKHKEIKDITKGVKEVVILANPKSKKDNRFNELFENAKFSYYDEYSFSKL